MELSIHPYVNCQTGLQPWLLSIKSYCFSTWENLIKRLLISEELSVGLRNWAAKEEADTCIGGATNAHPIDCIDQSAIHFVLRTKFPGFRIRRFERPPKECTDRF